jgi:hypothetical protein
MLSKSNLKVCAAAETGLFNHCVVTFKPTHRRKTQTVPESLVSLMALLNLMLFELN